MVKRKGGRETLTNCDQGGGIRVPHRDMVYGLVELAEDYDSRAGILRSHKDLRNSGTHRFVVLHDLGDPSRSRQAPEIEHHHREHFTQEVLRALRVARSAIQMLALAISQHERGLGQRMDGFVGTMIVPDHHWIRGHDEESLDAPD